MDRYEDLIAQAKLAHKQNRFADAIAFYEQAFEDKIIVEDMVDLGFVYLDDKNPFKAVSIFEDLIEVADDYPLNFYGLGLALEEVGRKQDAIKAYEMVVKIDPTFSDVYFNLALIYEDLEDEEKAFAYYEKTLQNNPNHFWGNLNIGSYYEKKDKLDLALTHTLKAYHINQHEKMISYNLGVIYGRLKQYDKALVYYKEELTKPHPFILAYMNIGLIYKDAHHDYQKALYYYLEGISKDKDNATLWYNLGCLYVVMNDENNAYHCFLYATIKDESLFKYMESDEELITFRKTTWFSKLMENRKG